MYQNYPNSLVLFISKVFPNTSWNIHIAVNFVTFKGQIVFVLHRPSATTYLKRDTDKYNKIIFLYLTTTFSFLLL